MKFFTKDPEHCERDGTHRDHNMGYNEWFEYCDRMAAKGIDQRQCPDCGLWIWPDHWGSGKKRKTSSVNN